MVLLKIKNFSLVGIFKTKIQVWEPKGYCCGYCYLRKTYAINLRFVSVIQMSGFTYLDVFISQLLQFDIYFYISSIIVPFFNQNKKIKNENDSDKNNNQNK